MPKAERLEKFRNDSVDEVDTTDLENWCIRGQKDEKMDIQPPGNNRNRDDNLSEEMKRIMFDNSDPGNLIEDGFDRRESMPDDNVFSGVNA